MIKITHYKQGFFAFLLLFYQPSFAQEIVFTHACAQGPSIYIAAVGDVLIHYPLLVKGNKSGFDSLWQAALPYIQSADIAYANLEGPIAENISETGKTIDTHTLDTRVYSSYPAFNYPINLAVALKRSGFDIVSTANNHALDRSSIGINKTIEVLEKLNLFYTGTQVRNSNSSWVKIINKNGFKVAWIACTENTNDNLDKYHQVLYCYKKKDAEQIINIITTLKSKVDAIIITPHWGEEYASKPNHQQINFAHKVLDAGANVVLGSHPHVLQPLEKYITKDGRETLIMFSLGNFISYQGSPQKRATIVLLLGLSKTDKGTVINGVRYVPMYMQNRNGIARLHLEMLSPKNLTSEFYKNIFNVLPKENAIFIKSVITNSSCYKSKSTEN